MVQDCLCQAVSKPRNRILTTRCHHGHGVGSAQASSGRTHPEPAYRRTLHIFASALKGLVHIPQCGEELSAGVCCALPEHEMSSYDSVRARDVQELIRKVPRCLRGVRSILGSICAYMQIEVHQFF